MIRLIATLLVATFLLFAQNRAPYRLGAGDLITIRIPEIEEVHEKPIRLDDNGDINLATVGRLHASGMTIAELEVALNQVFRKLVLQPTAVVSVTEMKSQPVSVAGAVRTPGVVQLQGSKALLEVLALAGGLAPEAGYRVQVARPNANGPLPLKGAHPDSTGQYQVGEVTYKGLIDGTNPGGNIQILANDTISVPKAELVYVLGEVRKPGGFALNDNEKITALQALAMAEGSLVTAANSRAVIKRKTSGDTREDIPVNLSKVLANKSPDIILQPNDILIVPNSEAKRLTMRAMEMLVQAGTGIVVYRR